MPRLSALPPAWRARPAVPAVAALLAAVLGVAGCSALQNAAGKSSSSTSGSSPGAGPAKAGPLLTEPAAGFSPVYKLISRGRYSIDVTMYEFSDTTAEHDLAAAARRGVSVRVILDQKEKGSNSAAYQYLTGHQVKVVWSWTRYQYTHQKTIVVDDSTAVIMTANLTSQYYQTSRDFLVTDKSQADIRAITAVFDADFAHRAVQPGDGRDLVWSPTDSQRQLLALINGASKSLRIYSEEMGDATIEDALIAAARRGVDVRVCGENEDGEYDSDFSRLAAAGVHVAYYSSSDGFYIHGKLVEADYGTSRARMFIGSENFSSTSLNSNRELGLIITSQPAMKTVVKTFGADYRNGRHWSKS